MKTSFLILAMSFGLGASSNAWADDCIKQCTNERGTSPEAYSDCKNLCQNSPQQNTEQCGQTITTSTGEKKFIDCGETEIVNAGFNVLDVTQSTANSLLQSKRGSKELDSLSKKGNITVQDNYNSQARLADSSASLNKQQAAIQSAGALTQGALSVAHFQQSSVAKKTLAAEDKNIKDQELIIQTEESKLAAAQASQNTFEIVSSQTKIDNAKKSKELSETAKAQLIQEAKAQNMQGMKEAVVAATTAQKAKVSMDNASEMDKEAARLRMQAAALNASSPGQYMYNPQTTTGQEEGGPVTPPPGTDGVANNDPSGGPINPGDKDFNPNSGNDGTIGPQAGAFKEGDPNGAKGGGGGTALGSSGGTSASKDSGADGKQEGGPNKSQTGGQYAAGEGGSPKFSRGSGSTGVGFDSSFGDLLKKMLPGGDEKKDQASLELDSSTRTPASDQAAVIGRNKNIFIEISKRYQKKQSDGAVVFQ